MPLPPALRLAIESETGSVETATLRRAAAELSRRYREGKAGVAMKTAAEQAAYLVTRIPATYAANALVFRELTKRIGGEIRSLLDLGSGPGTALWAAAEQMPSLESLTAVERDTRLIEIARRLASHATNRALRETEFLHDDLCKRPQLPVRDLVMLSYSMGELDGTAAVLDWCWKLARVALVIVEPGTPKAFQKVLHAREWLIRSGATIAAPCPHHNECPLATRGDWCHFRARLERTSEHRRLKSAELGYEDEKFSYLIATRENASQVAARIVRHPLKHPGHVQLTLCTTDGLQRSTIGKSRREMYRKARSTDWGDAWPE